MTGPPFVATPPALVGGPVALAAAPAPFLHPTLTGRLQVNGADVADTGPDLLAGTPTALSGCSVSWGRSTTVDQPGAATASFTVQSRSGDASFLADLTIGARVDLWAAGVLTSGIGANTMTDPGFETYPLGGLPTSGPLAQTLGGPTTVVADPVHTGARALDVAAPAAFTPTGGASAVRIPPAPFTSDRTAWDYLPTLRAGDTGWLTYAVRVPAGAPYSVQAWAWRSPAGNTGNTAAAPPGPVRIGTGDWEQVTEAPFTVASSVADLTGWWAGVAFTWHPVAWEQLPPDQSWADTPGSWADYGHAQLDDVGVQYASMTPTRDVLIFTGRVTDVDVAAALDIDGRPVITANLIAADPIAELGNTVVGDQPWAVETIAARANRIMGLTGTGITVTVDAPAAGRPVSWRDVDRQPAAGLIQELATSSAAVAWMATHSTASGPYWYLEDPSTRRVGLYTLELVDGVVVIVAASAAGPFTELSACRVALDPIHWVKSVADVSTAVDVTWKEQTVNDKGQPAPTDRTETLTGTPDEITRYGWRRVGVGTQLSAQADALAVANILYARLSSPAWRMTGLSWDTRIGPDWGDDETTLALDLLDGQRRLGHPLLITDLPGFTPGGGDRWPVYVEGGRLEFVAGRWILGFNASGGAGEGASAPWSSLDPEWAWNEFDPGISWADLIGVAGPVTP